MTADQGGSTAAQEDPGLRVLGPGFRFSRVKAEMIVRMLSEGQSYDEIARVMGVARHTVHARAYKTIFKRAGVRTREELIAKVWRRRLEEAQRVIVNSLVESLRRDMLDTKRVLEHLEKALAESSRFTIE